MCGINNTPLGQNHLTYTTNGLTTNNQTHGFTLNHTATPFDRSSSIANVILNIVTLLTQAINAYTQTNMPQHLANNTSLQTQINQVIQAFTHGNNQEGSISSVNGYNNGMLATQNPFNATLHGVNPAHNTYCNGWAKHANHSSIQNHHNSQAQTLIINGNNNGVINQMTHSPQADIAFAQPMISTRPPLITRPEDPIFQSVQPFQTQVNNPTRAIVAQPAPQLAPHPAPKAEPKTTVDTVKEHGKPFIAGQYTMALIMGKGAEWDTNHWQDVGKQSGVQIKEDGQGRYIHIAPNSNTNSRWVKNIDKSAANPEGLRVKISPIALDTNGDGKIGVTGNSTSKFSSTHEMGRTVQFDMNNDGKAETIEWLKGDGDSLLVDNRDGKAASDMNGSRLFGDENGRYNNGYEKLAALDTNQDGKLTGAELKGLTLWQDDGDAIVEKGEMKSLDSANITRLNTQVNYNKDANNDTLMQSTAVTSDGKILLTEDIWFNS